MTRTRVAVVGCGHLGTIHARLLAGRDDAELVAVVDPSAEARDR
ncbi:MAG: Gfo/Idh/MocA family oxidoreductase, partial [Planctomycetota bacterium]